MNTALRDAIEKEYAGVEDAGLRRRLIASAVHHCERIQRATEAVRTVLDNLHFAGVAYQVYPERTEYDFWRHELPFNELIELNLPSRVWFRVKTRDDAKGSFWVEFKTDNPERGLYFEYQASLQGNSIRTSDVETFLYFIKRFVPYDQG